MHYIVGVANLISLWHGIDFASIRDKFFKLIVKLLKKTKIEIIFDKLVQVLMDSSFMHIFIVVWLRILRSMVKNLKVLMFCLKRK
jgi:hypothetical protein